MTRYDGAFPVSASEGTGTLKAGDLVSGVFGTRDFLQGAALCFILDDFRPRQGMYSDAA